MKRAPRGGQWTPFSVTKKRRQLLALPFLCPDSFDGRQKSIVKEKRLRSRPGSFVAFEHVYQTARGLRFIGAGRPSTFPRPEPPNPPPPLTFSSPHLANPRPASSTVKSDYFHNKGLTESVIMAMSVIGSIDDAVKPQCS